MRVLRHRVADLADGGRCSATAARPARALPAWPSASVLALVACAWLGGRGVAQSVPGQKPVMRVGITATMFIEVNPADALASAIVWSRGIVRQVGAWSDAEVRSFPDGESAVASVNAGTTDVVALSTLEYLALERRLKADPALVFETAGRVMAEYVLLVRPDVKSLAELKGKRLALYNAFGDWDLSRLWADVLLAEEGLGSVNATFSTVKRTSKRSQAALAVFFNQADAAVEERGAFETAVELNPQVGKAMKPIVVSPSLLTGLVCVRRSMSPEERRSVIEGGLSLRERGSFRQTFLLMRVTGLEAWSPSYLASARALVARQAAVASRKTRR